MRCDEAIYKDGDASAPPVELRCTLKERTAAVAGDDGEESAEAVTKSKPPKGTISWVPAEGAVRTEVRLYDHLFTVDSPDDRWEAQVSTKIFISSGKYTEQGS